MPDIPNNSSTTAIITGTGQFGGSLEASGDADWWRVNLTVGLTYDFVLTGDGTATSLDNGRFLILNSVGTNIVGPGYKNGLLSITAGSTGTYYIAVEDYESDGLLEGSYTLTARTNDTVVNNNTTTSILSGSTPIAGSLGQSNDSDWYKVSLTAGRNYGFLLSGDGSLETLDNARIRLYDSTGSTVLVTSYKGTTLEVLATLTGTYYIAIDDYQSESQAEGNFLLRPMLSDTIVSNTATTSALATNGQAISTIDAPGDSDWFRAYEASGLTYGYTITSGAGAAGVADPDIYMRDVDGNLVVYGDTYSGTSSTISHSATTSGYVYIQAGNINENDIGTYRINSIATDKVRNNNTSTALLRDGGRVDGTVDAKTDADWYKFSTVAGRTYTFTLSGDGTAGELDDFNLSLRSASGTIIQQNYTGYSDSVSVTYKATATGSVFLSAQAYYTASTGDFRLSAVSDAVAVNGTSLSDILTGGTVNNIIQGLGGNDLIFGAQGNDYMIGGTGSDRLYGGSGNDVLRGDLGNDLMYGGSGTDRAYFVSSSRITVDLAKTTAQNTGQGFDILSGIENVTTGSGSDRIKGNAANNVLSAGVGYDTLNGAAGNDILYGGVAADRFEFARGGDRDRVADFQNNVDTIALLHLGVSSVTQAMSKARQVGADVVFDFGLGDTLIVSHTTLAALRDDLAFA